MKTYPRHQIDIEISDLLVVLFSYLLPLNRNKLEQEIRSFWHNRKHVKICFTVRTALDSYFSALNLAEDSEVIMSAINIKDMVTIVKHHGLQVVPVDIQINDLSLIPTDVEALVTESTKVLIFAQLFGAVVDLKPLAELCTKHDILLIEDCAQAFCGTQYQGSPYADISLFSFGPIKSSTALGGAVLIAKSSDTIKAIERTECLYSKKIEYWFFCRILKYLLIKLLSFPIFYGSFIKLLTVRQFDLGAKINAVSRSFAKGPLPSQIHFKPPLHLLFLLHRRLCKNNGNFTSREQLARLINTAVVAEENFTDFGLANPTKNQYINALVPPVASRSIRPLINKEPKQKPAAIGLTLEFKFGSSRLSNTTKIKLDSLGPALQDSQLASFSFKIEGHTDAVGGAKYNHDLSKQRANSVKNI